nr:hypothetical protein 1634Bnrm3_p048 [Cryptomonas sp.]
MTLQCFFYKVRTCFCIKINEYRYIHILNIRNCSYILQLRKICYLFGNICTFQIIREDKNKSSILIEYGCVLNAQIAICNLLRLRLYKQKLIIKLLKNKTHIFSLFGLRKKRTYINIQISNLIYTEDPFDILITLNIFGILSKKHNETANCKFRGKIFFAKSYNIYVAEYFHQVMNGEIFLSGKIKTTHKIENNYYFNERKNLKLIYGNEKCLSKLDPFEFNFYSTMNIIMIMSSFRSNLCKKLFEISEIMSNFKWSSKRHNKIKKSNKVFLVKTEKFVNLKIFRSAFRSLTWKVQKKPICNLEFII